LVYKPFDLRRLFSVAAHFQRVVLIGQACTVSVKNAWCIGFATTTSRAHTLDRAMSATRFSAIRVLFLALVLAFFASASAAADDHDHDDHGDEETPVTWACTANCPTAAGDPVRTHRTTSLFAPREREHRALSNPSTERRAPGASRARYASSAGAAPPPKKAHPATRP